MFGKEPAPRSEEEREAEESYAKEQDQIWEDKQIANKYRGELERARDAHWKLLDKLRSKMESRDSVNRMKEILKGNNNLNGGAN